MPTETKENQLPENKPVKKYIIPVEWSVYSTITVAASSAEEALKLAMNKLDEIPCDDANSEYIDGSYCISTFDGKTPTEDKQLIDIMEHDSYMEIGTHGIDENGMIY